MPAVSTSSSYSENFCIFCQKDLKTHSRRHLLSHVPWFFGEFLCVFCDRKLQDRARLLVHAEQVAHIKNVGRNLGRDNSYIIQLRREVLQETRVQLGEEHPVTKLYEELCEVNFTVTQDLPDGFLEKDLFPVGPTRPLKQNMPEMDTPVQDETYMHHVEPVSPAAGISNGFVTDTANGATMYLGDIAPGTTYQVVACQPSQVSAANPTLGQIDMPSLPSPPRERAASPCPSLPKRQCSESNTDLLTRLAEMEQRVEQKLEALNRKVVETARSQTKDLERSFSRLEGRVDSSTKEITKYQKLLADNLQNNICGALQQLKSFKEHGGLTLPLVKGLEALAQEAKKIYEEH